jgi:hypothetical protein
LDLRAELGEFLMCGWTEVHRLPVRDDAAGLRATLPPTRGGGAIPTIDEHPGATPGRLKVGAILARYEPQPPLSDRIRAYLAADRRGWGPPQSQP